MTEDEANAEPLPAGDFGAWIVGMQAAIRGDGQSDVPCGTCTACCTSSQFVHIEPDETDTLAHIPKELLFGAPGAPPGYVLMGYDERGHCPMLVDDRCSIYEHRPRTCRTYDCRVFAATAVEVDADDDAKAAIGRRARRWVFTYPTADDRDRRAAAERAAQSLRDSRETPPNATAIAVRAIDIHEAFGERAADDRD